MPKLVQAPVEEHYTYRLSYIWHWLRLTNTTHAVYAAANEDSDLWTKCGFVACNEAAANTPPFSDPCKTNKPNIRAQIWCSLPMIHGQLATVDQCLDLGSGGLG